MRNHSVVSIMILLLTACAPVSNAVDTPTQMALVTLTQFIQPTRQRTAIAILTNTPTLTATKSRTPTPALSHTPSPTPDPYDQILFSPDNKYIAKRYDEYVYPTRIPTIEIWDNVGSLLWILPYQAEILTGDPRPSLRIYRWSNDSSMLYFYYAISYDGTQTLWDGFDLQTIEIATGTLQGVLPGEGVMAFSLSSDDDYIAYARAQDDPRQLIIRNLSNGLEQSTTIDLETETPTQIGWMSWSPRGDQFLFHAAIGERLRAILLDVKSMKQRLLLEFLAESYWFTGWSPDGVQFLRYPANEVIHINTDTGIVTKLGTATPAP